jgi:hypothetical protein
MPRRLRSRSSSAHDSVDSRSHRPPRPVPWCRRRGPRRAPGSTGGPAPAAPGNAPRPPSRTRSPGPTGHGDRTPGGRPASRPTAAADNPAAEPKNPSRAGTKSPVDSPCRYSSGNTSATLGSCGTTAARSPSGTGPAARSPDRLGGHPPAAPAPPPPQQRSGPPAHGRARYAPPAAARAHHVRRRGQPDSRRPRPPTRRRASAWHLRGPARPDPRATRHRQPHRLLHSACGVTLLTGVAAPVSHLGWSSRRVRRALVQEGHPQLQVIPHSRSTDCPRWLRERRSSTGHSSQRNSAGWAIDGPTLEVDDRPSRSMSGAACRASSGRVDDAAPSECPHLRKRTDSSELRICEDCRKVNP